MIGYCSDNGSYHAPGGVAEIDVTTDPMICILYFKDFADWTASGSWAASVHFAYEAA